MRKTQLVIAGLCCLSILPAVGCAKGPLRGLSFLNPQAQQLLAEEEKIAKSWPTLREEMTALVDQALKGSAHQQKVAAERLESYLTPDNPTLMRLHATDLLGKLPSAVASQGLAQAAADAELDVRLAACSALGQTGDNQSLRKLQEIINTDSDQDVQIAATRALGKIKSPEAIATLKQSLSSNQPALQVSAAEALNELTGKDFGRNIPKWEQYLASGAVQPTTESKDGSQSLSETFNNTIRKVGFFQQ